MMNSNSPLAGTILLFLTSYIRLVLSQEQPPLPCPPVGLENVMETQDDCNCFYALAASDLQDYDRFFSEDSVLDLPQSGAYIGPDAISEYSEYIINGVNIQNRTRDVPIFSYVRASGAGQCESFLVTRRGWSVDPYYTVNNQLGCATFAAASKFKYELTGNPDALISVSHQAAYVPDIVLSELTPLYIGSRPTAELVCDVIVNSCKDYSIDTTTKSTKYSKKGKSSKRNLQKSSKSIKNGKGSKDGKGSKGGKGSKKELDMESCVEMYMNLPGLHYSPEGKAFGDGDNQLCRSLHSFMASVNDVHCPHISFEREIDVNGKYKCSESAFTPPSDFFTSEEIAFIFYVGENLYGFPADKADGVVTSEKCPLAFPALLPQ